MQSIKEMIVRREEEKFMKILLNKAKKRINEMNHKYNMENHDHYDMGLYKVTDELILNVATKLANEYATDDSTDDSTEKKVKGVGNFYQPTDKLKIPKSFRNLDDADLKSRLEEYYKAEKEREKARKEARRNAEKNQKNEKGVER